MQQPIIGVTTFRTINPEKGYRYISVTESYTRALLEAGATPVLIPLNLPETSLATLVEKLDGLLLTGGGDIDPIFYRGPQHPLIARIDPERDRSELALVRKAVQDAQPFFGICRGLQAINVALGGTLIADLSTQIPRALKHDHYNEHPWDHRAHPIQVQEGSRLSAITNLPILEVNSLHHQAAGQLGEHLSATAHAPDGTIEAIELDNHPFGLGVQWHPEWLIDDPPHFALFQAFVAACRQGSNR